jgi:hypothetical protein
VRNIRSERCKERLAPNLCNMLLRVPNCIRLGSLVIEETPNVHIGLTGDDLAEIERAAAAITRSRERATPSGSKQRPAAERERAPKADSEGMAGSEHFPLGARGGAIS